MSCVVKSLRIVADLMAPLFRRVFEREDNVAACRVRWHHALETRSLKMNTKNIMISCGLVFLAMIVSGVAASVGLNLKLKSLEFKVGEFRDVGVWNYDPVTGVVLLASKLLHSEGAYAGVVCRH